MGKLRLSAGLPALYPSLPLNEAMRSAKAEGFDAVEFDDVLPEALQDFHQALEETGLSLVSLSTARGDRRKGELGLSALPGREAEARAAIDQAVEAARSLEAQAIHVRAGCSRVTSSGGTFAANLQYACQRAPERMILIKPVPHAIAPGYYLRDLERAVEIIETLCFPNLKIMLDLSHMPGPATGAIGRLQKAVAHIGHIHMPSRPSHDDRWFLHAAQAALDAGYQGAFGAIWGTAAESLRWLADMRKEISS